MRAVILSVGIAGSVALHVLVSVGVSRIQPKKVHGATAVAVVGQKKKPKPKEDEKKPDEPPKPPPEPPKIIMPRAPKAAPPPTPPPADAPPPTPAPAAATPNTGNYANLSGLSFGNGPGGIAVAPPSGGGGGGGGGAPTSAPTAAPKQVEKSFGSNGSKPVAGPDPAGDCADPEVKARETAQLTAPYSDDARAAGVGGKVYVKVTIDASGNVTDAKVTKGLGHGLDENAVATAKRWKFSPATRCGKPVASTKVISFVFELAE
jgi:protein TonB